MPFGLSFSNPFALALFLPLAIYFVWLSRRSLADLSPARRRFSTGLRLFILALLVFALAGTQIVRFNRDLATIFVLDYSDSVTPDAKTRALKFIQDAVNAKKPSDKAGIIVFGREAYIELAPNTSKEIGQIKTVTPTEFTDLAAAIRLGLASFPDGLQKKLVVLSDGNENLGDALEESFSAASNDVQIDVVPLVSPARREVLLENLTLPNEAKRGEPIEIRVLARSTGAARGTIRLFRDQKLLGSREVELSEGRNTFSFPQTVEESGAATFEARLEVKNGADSNAENNRALGFVNVQGEPRVLLVSGAPQFSGNLVSALQREKVRVEVRGAGGVPPDLRAMQPYDSIVLDDVPAWSLTAQQMQALQSYVRDLGGGLVMIGGENSFGPGGYRQTPVEEALPVSMDIKQMQLMPGGAVAMIMHSCEFPAANEWSKAICTQATRQLGDNDWAGLIVYGMNPVWVYKDGMMKVGPNRAYMLGEIRKINPGDMPDFDAALELAYEGLMKTRAYLKHVIILSDGDPSPPDAELVKRYNDAKITVSTIVIQPHDGSGDRAMFNIARQHGGRFYKVNKPAEIPNVFLKETATISRSAIIEETFVPKQNRPSSILKGIGSLPPLLGYVGATTKPTAQEILQSKSDDPILSKWQYGLGKSVAFTSDARARWAAGWLPWSGFSKFWSQGIRWSMRATTSADLQTDVRIEKGRGTVSVEAVDEGGNFQNFLRPKARLVAPNFESRDLELEQVGPGRYEASFDARALGTYLVNIRTEKEGETRSQITGGVLPYSPEYGAIGTDEFLLSGLAQRTSGAVLDLGKAAQVFGGQRKIARLPVDIWLPLLMLAALLFPLDVAARRLIWGEEQLEKLGARRSKENVERAAKAEKTPRKSPKKAVEIPKTTTQKPPPSAPETPVSAEDDEADLSPMERLRRAKQRARGE